MKKLSPFVAAIALAALVTSANAETLRLGGSDISASFNPTRIIYKTADYTATTSDSQINCDATSNDVTITLPTVAAARAAYGGSQALKLVKTDSASTYTCDFAAATGDTVGGESARYVVQQNDYVIISSGPNNDWSVSFESSYVKENHANGSVNFSGLNSTELASSTVIVGTTPYLGIGDAGAEDTKMYFDGNAQDFYMGLEDATDKLKIGLGTTLGTTERLSFNSADLNIVVGDASAADVSFIYDGNAADMRIGMDDSADSLEIGVGSIMETTERITVLGTGIHTVVTLGDAVTAADTQLVYDGNAADFHISLDDSADSLEIGLGATPETTERITISSGTATVVTLGDAVTAVDTTLVYDGNAQDFYIGLDDTDDDLNFGLGATPGTTTAFSIDEDLVTTWAGGTVELAATTTAADTLTVAECGKTIFLNNATGYATALPTVGGATGPAGCEFTFVVKTALTSGNHTVTTGNSLENVIYGMVTHAAAVSACADEDTISFVDTALPGAWAHVVSDGAAWYVTGEAVTTNLITCTQAD